MLEADYGKARSIIAEAIDLAQAAGRPDLEARGELALARILAFSFASDEELDAEDAAAARAAGLFRQLGDTAGRIAAESIRLELDFGDGRLQSMVEKGLVLVEEALASNARAEAAPLLNRLGSAASWWGRPELAADLLSKAGQISDEASLVAASRFTGSSSLGLPGCAATCNRQRPRCGH